MLEPTWNFIFVIPTRDRREQGGICCFHPEPNPLTTRQKAFELGKGTSLLVPLSRPKSTRLWPLRFTSPAE
jgi:hypothetical protein